MPAAPPVHAASSLTCLPSLSLPVSSPLFLCQLFLSRWLHSHCCVPLCHLSLPFPPFFPDPLILLTLSFVKKKKQTLIYSHPYQLCENFADRLVLEAQRDAKKERKSERRILRPNKSRARHFCST